MTIITEKEKKSSYLNGYRNFLLKYYLRELKHFPKICDTQKLAELVPTIRISPTPPST